MEREAAVVPAVCFVGRSKVGKTTVLEKLIPVLKRRGYRVGTLKHHSHPGFEIDWPGKDTWRHAQAGSDHVVIAAPDKVASIRRIDEELALPEILAGMDDVDIVLVEGYKRSGLPKIEVYRAGHGPGPLCAQGEAIAAVADCAIPVDGPVFGLEDSEGLADFLEGRFLRADRPEG